MAPPWSTARTQRPSTGEKVGSTLSSHTRKIIQIIAIQLAKGNLGEQVGSMPWSALDLKPATQVTDTFLHQVEAEMPREKAASSARRSCGLRQKRKAATSQYLTEKMLSRMMV